MLNVLPIDAITPMSSLTTISIVVVEVDPRSSMAVSSGSETGRVCGASGGAALNLRNRCVTPHVQVLIIVLLLLLLIILCIDVGEARKVIKPQQ